MSGLSVLVVEDSAVQLAHALALCRKCGVQEVHGARNGQLGLEALAALARPPSLLLIDMVMPVMDGISMIEALHARDICLPVALASTMNDAVLVATESLVTQLGLPFMGTLNKPLAEAPLRALLAQLVGREPGHG